MANKRISELPAATTLQDSDLFAVVQAYGPTDETRKTTLSELRKAVGGASAFVGTTNAQLAILIANNALVVGMRYCMTDFKTVYIQPVSGAIKIADTGESLILTAVSTNSFARQVQSLDFPNDEIEYEFASTVPWNVTLSTPGNSAKIESKGQIVYRKDENGNECGYDHRTIKFRRWAKYMSDPNTQTPEYILPKAEKTQSNEKIPYGNYTIDGNNGTVNAKTVIVYHDESAYADFLTFGNDCKNNKICVNSRTLSNIIMGYSAANNTIINAQNIHFFGNVYNNYICGNAGGYNFDFIATASFEHNVIKGNVLQKSVFSSFYKNTVYGSNGAFSNNYFGDDCQGNVLKSTWGGGKNNTMGRCFKFNEIHCISGSGDSFSNNTIGNDFSKNHISGTDCFNSNTIGSFFQGNTICGHHIFTNNTVGAYFLYNSITGNNTVQECTFGSHFEHNVANQALRNCQFGQGNAYNEWCYNSANDYNVYTKIVTGDYCKHIKIHGIVSSPLHTLTFGNQCEEIAITKDCSFSGNLNISNGVCNLTIARTYTNRDLHIDSDHFADISNMISNGIECKVFGNDNVTDMPIRIKYLDANTAHDVIIEATNR